MAAVAFCGDWLLACCDTRLVAVHSTEPREPFVFDCSTEKKPKDAQTEASSDGGGPEETGGDRILSMAVSPSGRLTALTDDSKRLVLFSCEPAWRHISTRWVVRRCTSLAFARAEDELLVADKSGDVYSFSVSEPHREGELQLGHLSMLLAIALTPDDRFVITADRDEKIRVSRRRAAHDIQAYCLGHREFVSALLVPPTHPHWLLSGSGDGTLKLWDYESGKKLQSLDLQELHHSGKDTQMKAAVCRICSSPDGCHVAVQLERVPAVHFLGLDESDPLGSHSRLALPHSPLDVTFDPRGRLWVLMASGDDPLGVFAHRGGRWESDAQSLECVRATQAIREHWDTLRASEGAASSFQHLYKVNFDNTASYLQKKQERLQQQQTRKRKQEETKANGSDHKKAPAEQQEAT